MILSINSGASKFKERTLWILLILNPKTPSVTDPPFGRIAVIFIRFLGLHPLAAPFTQCCARSNPHNPETKNESKPLSLGVSVITKVLNPYLNEEMDSQGLWFGFNACQILFFII